MPVIRVRINERVGVRIRVQRAAAHEMRPGKCVPKMAVDRVDVEEFAELIPVVPPRVRVARRDRLEYPALRLVAPHPAAHRHTLFRRTAGRAHFTRSRATHAPVEPAIRAEAQAVGEIVIVLLRHREAVEHHLRRAIRHIVAIAIGDEEHIRRTHRPHTAAAHLDAREHLQIVAENFARGKMAVVIFVLEDEDAVAQPEIEFPRRLGVGVILRDPQPPASVPRHRDGIPHIRLGGKHGGLETRRQRHLRRGLRRRHRPGFVRLRVVRNGKVPRMADRSRELQEQKTEGGRTPHDRGGFHNQV